MSAASWTGTLFIGVGWAVLDAQLGDNAAHSHLAVQVVLGLDGPVIVATDKELVVPKGSAVMIPAGLIHSVGPAGRKARSVYIDPRFNGDADNYDRASPTILDNDLSAALRAAVDSNKAKAWARRFTGWTTNSGIDARIRKALIKTSAVESPSALAREVDLSPSRLREIVKAEFGVSPSKLLQWLQLIASAKAMATSTRLCDAAAAGGFSDQAHFTRRLRQWFGVTPGTGLQGLEISIDGL